MGFGDEHLIPLIDEVLGHPRAVVMCGHGERAATAASLLIRSGATDLAVLRGGPQEWAQASMRPLESGQ